MIYEWAVIGAGPSGIAAVGKLIDHGIDSQKILWIDPTFTVGDFGTRWRNIPGNTKVQLFLKYLHACHAFNYHDCKIDFELNHLDPDSTCYLKMMVEPLQWITAHLKGNVHAICGSAESLALNKRNWHISLNNTIYEAKNVILATGAEAKSLSYAVPEMLPLYYAMDNTLIHHHIDTQDTIAVFGSSHSAILVLRNLVEAGVKQIINFYRSPLCYAVFMQDWILFDDTGLKGTAADWARQHIDGNLPKNLIRLYSSDENVGEYLPKCNRVVYAIGFERRMLPIVHGLGHLTYQEQCGIIAPGLFGLGIAFPEAKYNKIGLLEYRVGLWKFMQYLDEILSVWLLYPA